MDRSVLNHSIGLPEMDAQHSWLYSLFDRIEPAGKRGDAYTMRTLLNEIEGYLLFHFASEEHLMRHYKFPGFAAHTSDHEAAGTRLVRFLEDLDAGRLNSSSLRIFLTGWLSEHAQLSDAHYVQWIEKCREKLPPS